MAKSKLSLVREALWARKDIQVVGVKYLNENLHWVLGPTPNGWTQTMNFFVGLRDTCVDPKRLQEILDGLIPGLQATCIDRFSDSDSELRIGVLYFDEVIGTETVTREVQITDDEVLSGLARGMHGILSADGKATEKTQQEMKRRTWVRLYPNTSLATAALRGENEYAVPKTLLTDHASSSTLPSEKLPTIADRSDRKWSLRRLIGR